jgi:hypothetical protein
MFLSAKWDERMGAASVGSETMAAAGQVLGLVRDGKAWSRPELERVSGLSRVTVAQRLRTLFEAGLVVEGDATEASGGRPARLLHANPNFAIALAADVGESAVRVAATDLSPRILRETVVDLDVASGPQATLKAIVGGARRLAADLEERGRRALGIGVSLPAPVNHRAGRVVGPSVMRGWDDFDVC